MPSLFLHKISVVRVYVYVAATTADSVGWDLRHHTLLVGMQTGAATVENSMEFPQKTKNGTAL